MTRITEWKDGSRWGWKTLLQEESPEVSPKLNRQNAMLAPCCLTYPYRHFAKSNRFLKILLFFLELPKFLSGVLSVLFGRFLGWRGLLHH